MREYRCKVCGKEIDISEYVYRDRMCYSCGQSHIDDLIKQLRGGKEVETCSTALRERGDEMKPKLGRIVYILYDLSIIKTRVGYIGKDSFIIEDFSEDVLFDSLEWWYEDYGKTWFTSLTDAKQQLIKEAESSGILNARIKKIDEGYWEIKE